MTSGPNFFPKIVKSKGIIPKFHKKKKIIENLQH